MTCKIKKNVFKDFLKVLENVSDIISNEKASMKIIYKICILLKMCLYMCIIHVDINVYYKKKRERVVTISEWQDYGWFLFSIL